MREAEELQQVPISIDTFDSEVACQAVAAGAHMVNDVSGGLLDPKMHAQVRLPAICILVLLHCITYNQCSLHYRQGSVKNAKCCRQLCVVLLCECCGLKETAWGGKAV